MRKTLGLAGILAVALAVGMGCAAQAAESAETGLIPPPAISIPYGGKIVTEVNLSDKDVPGVVKQIIPSIGEVAATIMPMAARSAGDPMEARVMEAVGKIDFQGLADAIAGITNFRVLVVKYATDPKITEFQQQLDSGAAKLGKFSRVLSDVSMMPGLVALYAQADGGGYVGYAYNSSARTLYAVRIVGFADIPKLTQWVVDVVKLVAGGAATEPEEPETEPASEGPPAETPAPETVTPPQ